MDLYRVLNGAFYFGLLNIMFINIILSDSEFKKQNHSLQPRRGKNADFKTEDLLSLRKEARQPVDVAKIENEGFNDGKNYLNAFIVCLQQPSSKNRMDVFKKLQLCLKREISLKENPMAQKMYKSGIVNAEKAMFSKLQ